MDVPGDAARDEPREDGELVDRGKPGTMCAPGDSEPRRGWCAPRSGVQLPAVAVAVVEGKVVLLCSGEWLVTVCGDWPRSESAASPGVLRP
jgi:hypothetical protein